ncbi:MAG: hypothetical protein CL798_04005 [Chromatiales bacterium]|nr:hypothetical protein [Chromatiales bacterium]
MPKAMKKKVAAKKGPKAGAKTKTAGKGKAAGKGKGKGGKEKNTALQDDTKEEEHGLNFGMAQVGEL